MTRLLLLVLISAGAAAQEFAPPPTEADWNAARCAQQGDKVICSTSAFKELTDAILEAETEVKKLQLQLTARGAQLEALRATPAVVFTPPADVKPVKSHTKPLVAAAVAALGTAALSTAILASTFSTEARVGLGITGAVAVVGSFAIIIAF